MFSALLSRVSELLFYPNASLRFFQFYRLFCVFFSFRRGRVLDLQPPVAVQIPIIPQQFGGVLGAVGTVAATHRLFRAIPVASPADSLRVFGMQGKFPRHMSIATYRGAAAGRLGHYTPSSKKLEQTPESHNPRGLARRCSRLFTGLPVAYDPPPGKGHD